MKDLNHTTQFYRRRFRQKESQFNIPSQLPDYFAQMIGDRKQITIGEMGAGPINTIGNFWPGVDVTIYASDWFWDEYRKFWKHHNKYPLVPVEYQNMEKLTYSDEMFDIVHCVNALDHTVNANFAMAEFMRVCKKGGWIYLRHAPNQRSRHAREHRWDIDLDDDICTVKGRHMSFVLTDYGEFNSYRTDDNFIVSICQKK